MHLGRDIDMSGEDMSTAMSGDTTYTVKEERELAYLGLGFGSFIVFSDATFQKAVVKDRFQKDMMVIRVPKNELKEVTRYIQGQKEKGVLEEAFSKKIYLDNIRKEEVLYLVMGVVLGISVLFLGMFVLWLKIYAETRQLKDKYQMLHALGMKQMELRKTLRKEISLIIIVPMLLTTVLTVVFILGRMYAYAPVGQTLYVTLKQNNVRMWLLEGVTFTYLFFELIFMWLVQVWSGKKIWMLK